ncbi:N-acetylglucosamine-6-phosphate deacetylase [Paenibacillus sacheonensis]|uniref:N-acetylglucosamine-6-phosphate deacetylase n=1 Tax=Paenibacillus sacheonensis TaxID=742054 RepID=A0A7X4YNM5_9BACL|nr:N-acetylglucosamine-6-phosphate deacetylase [Paenibacillus sacheonensis]MBM7565434.1 N-acetylglucosamine-6-phosphate deacetylase [Paenibacillus sacheonensis]NBC69638.1 N-acetylglucosamine-6-phosphate deacetylase [Paenibacillus sacheonensis]
MNTAEGKWLIRGINAVIGDNVVRDAAVAVTDGIITKIMTEDALPDAVEGTIVDGKGGWLLPGFIDLHVHGGFGADFMDASGEAYDAITSFHASRGTTRMLATTVTASPEAIAAVLEAAASYRSGTMPYASLEGVHLEGPFISELWPGAQNPSYISQPRLDWVQAWNTDYPGLIKQLTLAPEKEGSAAVISYLAAHGIVAAAGHTDARYEQIEAAVEAGLTQAVHTFNAMRALHHREPGTVGAVLSDDRIYAELIADGHHVHPAAIRLLVQSKPRDRVILITDAISAAGLGDGSYELGGLDVDVLQGVARLRQGGALAGSTLTMIDAFRFVLANTRLSVAEVSRMASGNPARQLGLQQVTGSIEIGKLADLVLTDAAFSSVIHTWVQGRLVHDANAGHVY